MNTKPFFLTGANAKIVLNHRTIAYATDISFNVNVAHFAPRLLGRFEVEDIQPLTYDVQGSLTIIRYARGIDRAMGEAAPQNTTNKGNGPGSFGQQGMGLSATLGLPNTTGQFDGAADEAFVPARFFQSKMFDIEIRQKVDDHPPNQGQGIFGRLDDLLVRDRSRVPSTETLVVRLRDCRLTQMGFNLSKRSPAMQTYGFRARYMDDDTAIARKSGVGQELV